jgi:hypothetical protein
MIIIPKCKLDALSIADKHFCLTMPLHGQVGHFSSDPRKYDLYFFGKFNRNLETTNFLVEHCPTPTAHCLLTVD